MLSPCCCPAQGLHSQLCRHGKAEVSSIAQHLGPPQQSIQGLHTANSVPCRAGRGTTWALWAVASHARDLQTWNMQLAPEPLLSASTRQHMGEDAAMLDITAAVMQHKDAVRSLTQCRTGQKASRQGKADCFKALTKQQQRPAGQHRVHQPGSPAVVKLRTASACST